MVQSRLEQLHEALVNTQTKIDEETLT
jgi:hypothetical protein